MAAPSEAAAPTTPAVARPLPTSPKLGRPTKARKPSARAAASAQQQHSHHRKEQREDSASSEDVDVDIMTVDPAPAAGVVVVTPVAAQVVATPIAAPAPITPTPTPTPIPTTSTTPVASPTPTAAPTPTSAARKSTRLIERKRANFQLPATWRELRSKVGTTGGKYAGCTLVSYMDSHQLPVFTFDAAVARVKEEEAINSAILHGINSTAKDHNNVFCSKCGDVGDLVCCDGCPTSFHAACLPPTEAAVAAANDKWYCKSCSEQQRNPPNKAPTPATPQERPPKSASRKSLSILPVKTSTKRKPDEMDDAAPPLSSQPSMSSVDLNASSADEEYPTSARAAAVANGILPIKRLRKRRQENTEDNRYATTYLTRRSGSPVNTPVDADPDPDTVTTAALGTDLGRRTRLRTGVLQYKGPPKPTQPEATESKDAPAPAPGTARRPMRQFEFFPTQFTREGLPANAHTEPKPIDWLTRAILHDLGVSASGVRPLAELAGDESDDEARPDDASSDDTVTETHGARRGNKAGSLLAPSTTFLPSQSTLQAAAAAYPVRAPDVRQRARLARFVEAGTGASAELPMTPFNEDAILLSTAITRASQVLTGVATPTEPIQVSAATPQLNAVEALLFGALHDWGAMQKSHFSVPQGGCSRTVPLSMVQSAQRRLRPVRIQSVGDIGQETPTIVEATLAAHAALESLAPVIDAPAALLSWACPGPPHSLTLDSSLDERTRFSAMERRAHWSRSRLRVAPSGIAGLGLYAMVDIPIHDIVIEYVGELVSNFIADKREKKYQAEAIKDYMFRLNDLEVVDATTAGSIARYINHSCDPNCYASLDRISAEERPRVFVFAKRQIKAGEELTYDYQFAPEDEKIMCLCKSAVCRGTLN